VVKLLQAIALLLGHKDWENLQSGGHKPELNN
jgi:hypothetical protein